MNQFVETSNPVAMNSPAVSEEAQFVFSKVWQELLNQSKGPIQFPKEIWWLSGAPGAGKGTNTETIRNCRSFDAETVIISDLCNSPEAQKIKDSGQLISDYDVTLLLFRALMSPSHTERALVDGYPRTFVQAEIMRLLSAKMSEMGQSLEQHIIVLYIDEKESIARQLKRGQNALQRSQSQGNETVEIRKTDLDESAARKRYLTFYDKALPCLESLKQDFAYHLVDAHGSIAEVQGAIKQSLA